MDPKNLDKMAGIMHDYMERMAFPNYVPRRAWPRSFRQNALLFNFPKARGSVSWRYRGREKRTPVPSEFLMDSLRYSGGMPRLDYVPRELVEFHDNDLRFAQMLAGIDPANDFGKATVRGARTAMGAQMILEQYERILRKWRGVWTKPGL